MSLALRDTLLQLYPAALNAVRGDIVVKKALTNIAKFKENKQQAYHLLAIGKAAEAMSLGAVEQLDAQLKTGLIISKHGHFKSHLLSDPRFHCIEADHPIPAKQSLIAGRRLIQYLQQLPNDAHCLVLISGGASSLAEVLQKGWRLDDLQEINQYLLENAYPIEQINAVRCQLSKIKAGGLWRYLDKKHVTCLMISDVEGDNPAVIGSGLLFPSNAQIPSALPSKWLTRFNPDTALHAPDFYWKIIATLNHAKQAVATTAINMGYRVKVDDNFLHGDAATIATECAKQLKQTEVDIIIWGGETTVNLPKNPPKGGRNQHFALAAAIELAGSHCALISVGTDGSDGTTEATGAIVDGQTLARGTQKGLSATQHLKQSDAYAFLKAMDALIITGTTGTNVMDIVIGIKNDGK